MSEYSGRRGDVIPISASAARASRSRGLPDKRIFIREYDHIIFICTIVLVAFGLVMVLSASYYAAMHSGGGMYSYFLTQAFGAGLGFVGMVFAATFNHKLLAKFALVIYAIGILLLILVLTPLGIEYQGAQRWIVLFGVNFQPSELAKVATIIMLANYISKKPDRVNTLRGLLGCLIILGIPIALVMLGRNLSTVIIIGAMGFVTIFLASPYFWRFAVAGALAAAGGVAFIIFGPAFRAARIEAWLDPFADPTGVGFQIVQSLYAVASGGIFGLGFGNSNQKLYFLPEAQNDFIFAIIVEELGLFGAAIVLMLFAILVWRGMRAAMNSRTLLGCLLATGIVTMISVQVIINVGVVTNTIPNTGIPLPFISYGGTSIAVMMTAVGILLNISRYQKTPGQGQG